MTKRHVGRHQPMAFMNRTEWKCTCKIQSDQFLTALLCKTTSWNEHFPSYVENVFLGEFDDKQQPWNSYYFIESDVVENLPILLLVVNVDNLIFNTGWTEVASGNSRGYCDQGERWPGTPGETAATTAFQLSRRAAVSLGISQGEYQRLESRERNHRDGTKTAQRNGQDSQRKARFALLLFSAEVLYLAVRNVRARKRNPCQKSS